MTLTFELARFTVREGEEADLVAERPEMIAALAQAFPGLLGAWLTKRDDSSWVDVILWESREAAEHAAKHVNDVPAAKAWFRHIHESHGLKHLDVVHEASELARRYAR
jgi:heme-degrading monooxygenase HmoA